MTKTQLIQVLNEALDLADQHISEKLGYGPPHARRVALLKKRSRFELAKSTLRRTRIRVLEPFEESA